MRAVEHEGMKIVLIRRGDQFFAYQDRCPHAFWPLSEGELHGGVVECSGHGWEFDVATGRCLNAPTYCLLPVEARIEGDKVALQWTEKDSGEGKTCSAQNASAPTAVSREQL